MRWKKGFALQLQYTANYGSAQVKYVPQSEKVSCFFCTQMKKRVDENVSTLSVHTDYSEKQWQICCCRSILPSRRKIVFRVWPIMEEQFFRSLCFPINNAADPAGSMGLPLLQEGKSAMRIIAIFRMPHPEHSSIFCSWKSPMWLQTGHILPEIE